MKKLMLIAAMLLFISTAFPQGVSWFKGDLDEAKVEAKKADKLILLDFSQKSGWGSAACKLLDKQFFNNPEYKAFLNKNFVAMSVDIQKRKSRRLILDFKVYSKPSVVILDYTGKEIGRIKGYKLDPKRYKRRVDDILAKYRKEIADPNWSIQNSIFNKF